MVLKNIFEADILKKKIHNFTCLLKEVCRWSIIAVVLPVALILPALTACGGNGKEIEDLDFAVDLEPEDIHIYTQGYGNNVVPFEAGEIENMLLEVTQTLSDGIKVTPVFHWIHYEKFEEEIEKLVKSGERVDMITTSSGYASSGRDVLMELGSLFPQYAPDYYNELISHNIGLQKLKNCTIDDKLMCIPANNISTHRLFVVVRKEMAGQFAPNGFETLEDYGEFMALVKENNPAIVPGNTLDPASFFVSYIRGNGYLPQLSYIFANWNPQLMYKYYSMEHLDEFASAYDLLKEWHGKGYIKMERGNAARLLATGQVASTLMSGLDIASGYMDDLVSEYEYVADPLYMGTPYEAHANTEGIAVGKSCTCPERVMMLLEWIHSSQESYDLFMYGIKNRNYVLDGDRAVFVSEEYEIKPIIRTSSARYFKDYRYERLYGYHPDNFKEVYMDACLTAVMTAAEINEKVMGITPEDVDRFQKDQETMEKYMKEYGNMQHVLDIYQSNWKVIMDKIGNGDFSHQPSDIIEMQRETGIDKFLDLLEEMHRKIRGE